jgi:hypothetical protein
MSFQGAICRMPSQGGTLTRLTREEGWDVESAWSPDGQRIAYINAPNFSVGQLRLIAADDGMAIKLAKPVVARGRLQFHPDGQRLIGMFTLTGQPDRLQWCDLNTGELTFVDILPLEARHRVPMKWALSSDGKTILFTTYQDLPGEQTGNNGPTTDLWQVPSNGGKPQLLTRWPSRIYGLCWTADSRGVFVVTDRGVAFNDLWHLPLDQPLEGARKITFGQADEDWPSVSADGRWLVHTENHQRATAIVRHEIATGQTQTLTIDNVEFREPTGTLRLALRDAQTSEPVVARVSIKHIGGKFHFPLGALYRFTAGVGHFYTRAQAELTVPVGKFSIQVWHGPEYLAHKEEVEITGGATREVPVALQRWVNMAERGWFSGENHIHANYGYGAWHNDPVTIRDQCEGEDLNVANVMVANSDGDGVFDRDYFLGRPDPRSAPHTIIYWNEEFRSTMWGHMTLGNLSQLVEPIFTGFKDTTNPWDVPTNADIADRTRAQRGSVSYTHPAASIDTPYDTAYAARGWPVDAALGRIDTADVMGSGYTASVRLWYRLLNCGFRFPATAGTDVFLNRVQSYPPGWGRAYVRLTNSLSYTDWIRGQQAGRTFVTTGPMLEFSVEGRDAGETLRFDAPRSVRVRARAWSQYPLANLEVVVNGQVVLTNQPGANPREVTLEADVQLERTGWLAVRCTSTQPSYQGNHAAHTSPVYVEMPGYPLAARADAEYFLNWIDRLEADVTKRNRLPTGIRPVKMQLDAARAVYQKLAK